MDEKSFRENVLLHRNLDGLDNATAESDNASKTRAMWCSTSI